MKVPRSDLVNHLIKEIHRCYKIAKQKHNSSCTTRSQLLYLALKNNGFEPKILRYLSSEKQEGVKFKLISGEMFESHVVVLLDKDILDSNLPKKVSKDRYEKELNKINKGVKIYSIEYNIKMNENDLKRICDECNLSHYFTDSLENLIENKEKLNLKHSGND